MPPVLQLVPLPTISSAPPRPAFKTTEFWRIEDKEAWLQTYGDQCEVAITHAGAGMEPKLVEALPKLKLVVNFGVGLDKLPLDLLRDKGIAALRAAFDDMADMKGKLRHFTFPMAQEVASPLRAWRRLFRWKDSKPLLAAIAFANAA